MNFITEESIHHGREIFTNICRLHQMMIVEGAWRKKTRCGRSILYLSSPSRKPETGYKYNYKEGELFNFYLGFKGHSPLDMCFRFFYIKNGNDYKLTHMREESEAVFKSYSEEFYQFPITEEKVFSLLYHCLSISFQLVEIKTKSSDRTYLEFIDAINNNII